VIELIAQASDFKLLLKDLDRVVYVMVQGKSVSYNGSNVQAMIEGQEASLEEAGRHYLDLELCRKFIAKLFAIGLLNCDDKHVWSESFNARMQRRVDIAAKRSVAGKIGNATRWGRAEEGIANAISQNRKHRKGKESKVKEIKYSNTFMSVWVRYPKRIGTKRANMHFEASVKNEEDLALINKALDNYLQYIEEEIREERYIKNGDTWFNNWRDWVEWKSEKPQRRML
jgi:hypothetical protein